MRSGLSISLLTAFQVNEIRRRHSICAARRSGQAGRRFQQRRVIEDVQPLRQRLDAGHGCLQEFLEEQRLLYAARRASSRDTGRPFQVLQQQRRHQAVVAGRSSPVSPVDGSMTRSGWEETARFSLPLAAVFFPLHSAWAVAPRRRYPPPRRLRRAPALRGCWRARACPSARPLERGMPDVAGLRPFTERDFGNSSGLTQCARRGMSAWWGRGQISGTSTACSFASPYPRSARARIEAGAHFAGVAQAAFCVMHGHPAARRNPMRLPWPDRYIRQ